MSDPNPSDSERIRRVLRARDLPERDLCAMAVVDSSTTAIAPATIPATGVEMDCVQWIIRVTQVWKVPATDGRWLMADG